MKIKSILFASMAMMAATAFVSCSDSNKEPVEGDAITIKAGDVSFDLVYVAPGSFRMGATSEQEGVEPSEKPVHDVQITKGYYIAKLEVSQELWQAVMGKNPSTMKQYEGEENLQLPVADITWADAKAFVKKLSEMTGETFRLPTEAEWEYAAREASKALGLQYSGSKYLENVACYKFTSNGTAHPVGQFMQNKLDMRDMNGNVSEWVEDNFASYPDSALVDPCVNLGDTVNHVARGGSFISTTTQCRTASRENYSPDYSSPMVGLRVVMEPKAKAAE